MPTYSIVMAFVDPDDTKAIKASLRRSQAGGFTVLNARGTVRSPILSFLGLDNPRRDMLLMVAEDSRCTSFMEKLDSDIHMDRPGKGFTFTIPATRLYGMRTQDGTVFRRLSGRPAGEKPHYEVIIAIVNNGMSGKVFKAARRGGAQGATVLHGRGSGVEKVERFFSLAIDPEKEILVMITEEEHTDAILEEMNKEVNFNTPNSGIVFTFDIEEVHGLIQNVGE